VTVDYMKVAPGQDDGYLQVEQKMWKPIHEARVKAGKALGWYLYRVASPSGTLVDHNYVTVAVYSSFAATENPYPDELSAQLSAAEFMKKTLAARDLVRSEVWGAIDGAPETAIAKPAPFLTVEYMKVPPGGDEAYVEVEKLWKKMHEVRIREGTLADWSVYGRISSYPQEISQWTSHEYSTSLKVLTASITRSHPRSSRLSARRCVWSRGPECSTSAAVPGRCCAPGHAITASSAPAST
jgi:hypothetical protein